MDNVTIKPEIKRYYCTLFDINYVIKGLALYHSLMQHSGLFELWVLCLDEQTHELLKTLSLPSIVPIALCDLEKGDTSLLKAKASRTKIEYYYTCTPSLPLYVLKKKSAIDVITYLDADLYFFSSPTPIDENMRDNSILIIECRYPKRLKQLEIYGKYNVGYLSFRNDAIGNACLNSWRIQCNEWCHDYVEGERYADQKYLDEWPQRFQNLTILRHKGACLAPWNYEQYVISIKEKDVIVDEEKLIFYHFHGFELRSYTHYNTHMGRYGKAESPTLRQCIYEPYLKANQEIISRVNSLVPDMVRTENIELNYSIPKVITQGQDKVSAK
jgi:hypothetical protein